jgi:succinyl-diaminopimelate desuccinylase
MANFVSRIQGKKKGKRLILNGHLDTFPAGDLKLWSRDPFGAKVENGRIFGRGVSDMKGGDTAMMMAFFYLSENFKQMEGEAVITLVADEETGGKWGTEWLLDHVPDVSGDAVLNGEPGSCDLVHFAEKGLLWIELISRGKAASTAYPHLGDNAIHNLCHFINDLEKLENIKVTPVEVSEISREGREVIDNIKGKGATDILGQITVNVGTIKGGLKCNLLPDYCSAELDIRFPHGIRSDDILSKVDSIRSRYEGIEYRVQHITEPNSTPVGEEIIQLTLKNAEFVREHRVFPSCGMNGTDCRHFRSRGIPSCLYGPRFYELGAPDENITVQDLMDSVKVMTLTAFDFLNIPY